MVERSIIWTKTADIQFVGILEYWVKNNKSTAYSKKLVALVTERTEQLSLSPEIYKKQILKMLGNYSIYNQTNRSAIIITAFWDNRQDPEKLLKILKNE